MKVIRIPESVDEVVGKNIIERRLSAKMSQAELSRLSGVSKPVVSRAENGENSLTIKMLVKLASALEATPEDLLEGMSEFLEGEGRRG
jgi:transcriptional regulator with XRE-family HTH domain